MLRLKGTNVDIAKGMIEGREKELGIFFDDNFDEAARKVVDIATNRQYREK